MGTQGILIEIGEMPAILFPLALPLFEAEVKSAAWLQRSPKATQCIGNSAGRQMQQTGTRPDAVVKPDFFEIGEGAHQNGLAQVFRSQCRQLARGIKSRDAITSILECLGITTGTATGIENNAACRNLSISTPTVSLKKSAALRL